MHADSPRPPSLRYARAAIPPLLDARDNCALFSPTEDELEPGGKPPNLVAGVPLCDATAG